MGIDKVAIHSVHFKRSLSAKIHPVLAHAKLDSPLGFPNQRQMEKVESRSLSGPCSSCAAELNVLESKSATICMTDFREYFGMLVVWQSLFCPRNPKTGLKRYARN
jgi:hypothetical protein